MVKNESNEVQQELGGQNLGAIRRIISGGDLHQIDASHLTALRQALQDLKNVIIQKAAMAWCARAWRNGGTKGVDVDGDIIPSPKRNALEHRINPKLTHLAHRQNIRAASPGIFIAFFRG